MFCPPQKKLRMSAIRNMTCRMGFLLSSVSSCLMSNTELILKGKISSAIIIIIRTLLLTFAYFIFLFLFQTFALRSSRVTERYWLWWRALLQLLHNCALSRLNFFLKFVCIIHIKLEINYFLKRSRVWNHAKTCGGFQPNSSFVSI